MQTFRMRQVYESWYGATYKINYLKEEEGGGGGGAEDKEGKRRSGGGERKQRRPAAPWTVRWQEGLTACLIRRLSLEGSMEPVRAVPWEALRPRVSSEGRLFPIGPLSCWKYLNELNGLPSENLINSFLTVMWSLQILSLVTGPAEGGDVWHPGGCRAAQTAEGRGPLYSYHFRPWKHGSCSPIVQHWAPYQSLPRACSLSLLLPLLLLFLLLSLEE